MGIFDKIDDGIFGKPDKDDADKTKAPPNFSDTTSGSSSEPGSAPRADFSDVTSGGSSTASAGAQTYTVKSGDSLSKIAKSVYGDASAWRRIYEANRDKIKNPDLIHPGQEFTIPAA